MIDPIVLSSALVLSATLVYVLSPLLRKPRTVDGDAASAPDRSESLQLRKAMVYQSIRDAELDHQTGKLSTEDFESMTLGLKQEAVAILRELDRLPNTASPRA